MKTRISGTTKTYGLIGSPVGHSGSPAMYNYSFWRLGIDSVYLAWEIAREQAADFLQAARTLDIQGFNVTMPCKMEMARLVDELSPAAQIVGAVNTVVAKEGKWIGHITDGVGFLLNLKDHGVEIQGKKITLLGGGGAGAAILAQAALDGAGEITVFNRRSPNFSKLENISMRLKEMAPSCKVTVRDLAEEETLYDEIRESQILINSTNVGMCPREGESLIRDCSVYRKDLIVSDIIYNPAETRMMRDAKNAGTEIVVGGKGMLLWQGAEAFRLYTGQEMPVEEVKERYFAD